MYEIIKRFMIVYVLMILIFTSCNNVNSDYKKECIYKNEIIKEIDLKENIEEIKIITTQSFEDNEELVVYSYYSNLNKRDEVGLKYAIWNNSNVKLIDMTVPQKYQYSCYIFFITHEPDDNESLIGNKYNTDYYTISYGAVFDDRIKRIKLIYDDGSALIKPVVKNGYIILRINNLSWVTNIEALDKDENVIYEEITSAKY